MRNLTQLQLSTRINQFISRKSRQLELKDPLQDVVPQSRVISKREIEQSYEYAPMTMRNTYTY